MQGIKLTWYGYLPERASSTDAHTCTWASISGLLGIAAVCILALGSRWWVWILLLLLQGIVPTEPSSSVRLLQNVGAV